MARKLYPYLSNKASSAMNQFFRKNHEALNDYADVNRERLDNQRERTGHDMRWAKGDLKRNFRDGMGKSTNARSISKYATEHGANKNVSRTKLRKNNLVKFGADPFHK